MGDGRPMRRYSCEGCNYGLPADVHCLDGKSLCGVCAKERIAAAEAERDALRQEVERLRGAVQAFLDECKADDHDGGGSPDYYCQLGNTIDVLERALGVQQGKGEP